MSNELHEAYSKIPQTIACTCGEVFVVPLTQTAPIKCKCGGVTTFEGSGVDITKNTIAEMQKTFDK